tara:strand:- start:2443 stop:2670 length:228 start_codon:yes stop_codon:yes gene_type:complete
MLIKFQRSMVLGVRKRAEAGEVVEVADLSAQSYIRQGWAIAAPAPKVSPAPEPEAEASPAPQPKTPKKSRKTQGQ